MVNEEYSKWGTSEAQPKANLQTTEWIIFGFEDWRNLVFCVKEKVAVSKTVSAHSRHWPTSKIVYAAPAKPPEQHQIH
jgi:hypothetical protein